MVLHNISCMSQSDLPSAAPEKTASEKPSALGGVHFERKKRKAAEARALAAEQAAAGLRDRVDSLDFHNQELAEKLKAALARAARSEALLKAEKEPHSLAALGLRFDANSGVLSGTPLADGLGLTNLGKGS
jgi:hypothetical protein